MRNNNSDFIEQFNALFFLIEHKKLSENLSILRVFFLGGGMVILKVDSSLIEIRKQALKKTPKSVNISN